MTTKTAQWFTDRRATYVKHGGKLGHFEKEAYFRQTLGKIIWTTARIKGQLKRVQIWIP